MQLALQLSVANAEPSSSAGGASAGFEDPSFVNQLLESADLNDPLVQAALAQLNAGSGGAPTNDGSKGSDDPEKSKKRKGDDI